MGLLTGPAALGLQVSASSGIGTLRRGFVCLEPKLVIEVDGGQHAEQAPNDAARSRYLEALGYTVIRFWNHEVLRKLDMVLEEIGRVLNLIPSPYPLPEGEGEKRVALRERERGKEARALLAPRIGRLNRLWGMQWIRTGGMDRARSGRAAA